MPEAIALASSPLPFTDYAFDARCYNTLACSVLFSNFQHSLHLAEPSGVPSSANWKNDWAGSFRHGGSDPASFPTPVEIRWTAMDGVERTAELDLDGLFPDRKVVHSVPADEVDLWWSENGLAGPGRGHNPDLLLEVNDRTLSLYMRLPVLTKNTRLLEDGHEQKILVPSLVQIWTRTY